MQEFFAAIFISSQSHGQNIVLDQCKNVRAILDMSTVCQFISGINTKIVRKILEGFISVINEDEETHKYRTKAGLEHIDDFYENPFHVIQDMFVSCSKEIPDSENVFWLQDLFISVYNEQDLSTISKVMKTDIKSINVMTKDLSVRINETFESFNLADFDHLEKVFYKGEKDKETEIKFLLSPCLRNLSLMKGTWTNYEDNLSDRLGQIQNLQYLYIEEITFSHEMLEIFVNFISNKKSLKEITLDRLDCKTHDDECDTIMLDLSHHSKLTKLKLYVLPPLQLDITTPSLVDVTLRDIHLGENSLLLSPEMLNIKIMKFVGIKISPEKLQNYVKILEKSAKEVKVQIEKCEIDPETGREFIRDYVRSSDRFYVTRDLFYEKDGEWRFVFKTVT